MTTPDPEEISDDSGLQWDQVRLRAVEDHPDIEYNLNDLNAVQNYQRKRRLWMRVSSAVGRSQCGHPIEQQLISILSNLIIAPHQGAKGAIPEWTPLPLLMLPSLIL